MFEIKSNRKLCGFWCSLFKSEKKAQPSQPKSRLDKGLYYNNVTDRRSIRNVVLVFCRVFQNHILSVATLSRNYAIW